MTETQTEMTEVPTIRFIERGDDLPFDVGESTYLVGAQGAFQVRSAGPFSYVERVPWPEVLAEVSPRGAWNLPKIPARLTNQMIGFFHAVYKAHHSEAGIIIEYNEQTKTFQLVAPPQQVSSGSCKYDMPRQRASEGFTFVGTSHSHGSMSAFHSPTDKHDEAHFDGLHLTVGYVDREAVGIVASLAIGEHRFVLNPEDVLDGVEQLSKHALPSPVISDDEVDWGVVAALAWLRKHRPDETEFIAKYEASEGRAKIRAYLEDIERKKVAAARRKATEDAQHYVCVHPDGITDDDVRVPDAWMEQVQTHAMHRWDDDGVLVGTKGKAHDTYQHYGLGSREHDESVWRGLRATGGDASRKKGQVLDAKGAVVREVVVEGGKRSIGFAARVLTRDITLPRLVDRALGRTGKDVAPPATRSRARRAPHVVVRTRTAATDDDIEPAPCDVTFENVRHADLGSCAGSDANGDILIVGDIVTIPLTALIVNDRVHRQRASQALLRHGGECAIVHVAQDPILDGKTFLYLDVGDDVGGTSIVNHLGRSEVPSELNNDPAWWARLVFAWAHDVTFAHKSGAR